MDSRVLIAIGVIFVLLVLAGGLLLVVNRRRQQASTDDTISKEDAKKIAYALLEIDNKASQVPVLATREEMYNDDFMEGFINGARKEWKVTNSEEEFVLYAHLNALLVRWGCDNQRIVEVLKMNKKYNW